MNITDNFSETVFRVKNTVIKFLDADPNQGSGIFFLPWIWDGQMRIRNKHPGFATLYGGMLRRVDAVMTYHTLKNVMDPFCYGYQYR